MEENKGFTLIELLSVIIILAIILVIAVPSILSKINSVRIQAYISNEKMLVKSAKNYVTLNTDRIPSNIGDTTEILFDDLHESGYIGAIKNPNGSNECNGYILITKVDDNQYEYIPHLNCINNIGSKVEDGLVANYKFDDYQESTRNVVTNTNLDTGWSKSYQSNIVFNEISPPVGVNSPTVGFTRALNDAYWYSYGDYAPQVPGETYTVSLYVKTLDPNFRIDFYTADNSEVGRYWSSLITVPNDGNWHRVVWNSFRNADDSQSSSLSFNFTYAGAIGDSTTRTWFCAPQMEPKDHVTPFVIGDRETVVKDYSGNGNAAQLPLNTAPTWAEDSKIGSGSFKFDGSEEIKVNHNNNLNSNIITLSTWIKPNVLPAATHQRIITKNATLGYMLNIYGSTIEAYVGNQHILGSNINVNEWLHVVATIENSRLKLYLNGNLVTDALYTGTINGSTSPLTIGSGNGGQYFNGYIDEVRIYTRGLNANEIKIIYDTEKNELR